MIDFTLGLLSRLTRPVYLVVVIRPNKEAVLEYIAQRWPELEVRPVMQVAPGFVGALRAAEPLLADVNLLLLPDQYMSENGAIEAAMAAVESGESTAMLVHYPDRAELIADDGALCIRQGRVADISEKPGIDRVEAFNAVWCGIGFRGEITARLIASLEALYAEGDYAPDDWQASPLRGALAIPVEDYLDLGVWDRLMAFQKSRHP